MNCLLTGSNGFLGKIISNEISSSNKIHGLSRSKSDFNVYLEKEVPNFNIQFDIVIHAAGKAHSESKTKSKKKEFYNVNVIGTKNLLEGLTYSGIPKYFVFISSVSVYGIFAGENINEDTILNADDPYGKSKTEAEYIVKKWCHEHNVICTILRLPLVVGENPPGNLGSMILGIKRGYYFNIAGGNAKKSMVLASDIAKYILKASEVGGIYNLTDGTHPTLNELSRIISKNLGKSFIPNVSFFIAKILAKFGDIIGEPLFFNSNTLSKLTSTLTFDDTKARKAFGWNPSSVLDGFEIYENA